MNMWYTPLGSPKDQARRTTDEGRHRGREEVGRTARHAGPDDSENAARAGPLARVWYRAPSRAGESRRAAAERGHRVHVSAAAAAAGLDHGRVGHIGEQPQGKVLRHHRARTDATRGGNGEL